MALWPQLHGRCPQNHHSITEARLNEDSLGFCGPVRLYGVTGQGGSSRTGLVCRKLYAFHRANIQNKYATELAYVIGDSFSPKNTVGRRGDTGECRQNVKGGWRLHEFHSESGQNPVNNNGDKAVEWLAQVFMSSPDETYHKLFLTPPILHIDYLRHLRSSQ